MRAIGIAVAVMALFAGVWWLRDRGASEVAQETEGVASTPQEHAKAQSAQQRPSPPGQPSSRTRPHLPDSDHVTILNSAIDFAQHFRRFIDLESIPEPKRLDVAGAVLDYQVLNWNAQWGGTPIDKGEAFEETMARIEAALSPEEFDIFLAMTNPTPESMFFTREELGPREVERSP